MKRSALLTLLVLTLALPSCGDDDSPTTPNNPTNPSQNPSQLTVQIAVSQATASTNIEENGPATQKRTINTNVTISNAAASVSSNLEDLRIFGTMIAGQDSYPFDVRVTPQAPQNNVPGGGTVTITTPVDVDIEEPFTVDSFFDVSAEVTWRDTFGSGTTPPVSTSVDPSLTRRPPGTCGASSTVDCVQIGGTDRFEVQVTWANIAGQAPQPAALGQQFDDGAFWAFGPDNTELLVQLIDNCSINDHYWVFFAATTNIEVNISVEDTLTNVTKTYTNPLGTPFLPIQDTAAFATCPGPVPVP